MDALHPSDKPVIVFVHGGGFTSGSARDPWYNGAALARRDAVVITIQYRAGPFGWLGVSSLSSAYAQSMNNGLLDQMAALRGASSPLPASSPAPSSEPGGCCADTQPADRAPGHMPRPRWVSIHG
ncbi:hypothetical protein GCM10023088_57090 [Actinomadura verrucosospora]